MDKDLIEFLVMLGVLVALFILIALFIQFLRWKLSRWDELSSLFPASGTSPDTRFYKYCPGQAGRYSFSKRTWAFTVGFSPGGITIRLKSKKYKDLFVPWENVVSAERYSLGSQVTAKVTVGSEIPLSFYLSEEALFEFERWHKVERKSLESFIDGFKK